MLGRHATTRRVASVTPRHSIRKLLASVCSMAAAFALAATVAIPAVSASAVSNPGEYAATTDVGTSSPGTAQSMTVSADATIPPIIRDNSAVAKYFKGVGVSILSTGGWNAPINRAIVSPWGPRTPICTAGVGCDSGFHRGDDFAAPCGTPFYAVSAGVVISVTHGGLAGDQITIAHSPTVSTAYSHMFDSGILVAVGQTVTAGQNIGLVGSSGDSTGCHLYFEFRIDGLTVDPQPEMASRGITLGAV